MSLNPRKKGEMNLLKKVGQNSIIVDSSYDVLLRDIFMVFLDIIKYC